MTRECYRTMETPAGAMGSKHGEVTEAEGGDGRTGN